MQDIVVRLHNSRPNEGSHDLACRCVDAAKEIERLRCLIDLAYDHLGICGYRDEDQTLTQLRTGMSESGLRREGFAPNNQGEPGGTL